MANQISVNTGTGNQQVTVTSTGNIQVTTSRSVIGTLANVQSANLANYVTQANQANITSLGTLTGLTSTGNITAPFFIGNVVGNISGNIVVPGSNQAVLFNNQGNAGASDAFKFNQSSNVVTVLGNVVANYYIGNGSQLTGITATDANTANYANFAGNAFSVAGANVTGAVAYATTANAVAGANVSGQVSYAQVANSVAGANVSGTVANATYATSAGTANSATVAASANSVAGANVTGTVANATFATTAGSATTAGTVTTGAQPNITSVGTLSTLSVSGNGTIGNLTVTGNLSVGNLFANNANYANFANVANTANSVAGSNVTGAVAFATTANAVAGANVSGTVANATYAANAGNATIANSANSVAVANVSGIGNIATTNYDGNASNVLYGNGGFYALPTVSNVANANYANFAGTVITNAQPNITSVGTLTSLSVTGNVSANAYQLTTSPGTLTAATGQMVWSTSEQTMNLGMNYGVTQQVGLESYILIKASATISDGQVVMFTGANGDNVTGAPANTASAGFRPEYIIGVATQDIANNGFGYVTVFGVVHGLNTNAYNVGDILWVDNATPGALTATRPSDPNFQIEVAAVTKKSGGDGHIQVRVTTFNDINSLTDVTITTPANGQALVYSGNIWVNGNPNQANFAATANSVALANVVGIGNIANINLDGSSSNVLYGNGQFATITIPAGDQISNGTSNVSIPTANGNVNISSNGVANIVSVLANGATFITPPPTVNGALTIDSYSTSGGDVHRINSRRARGNATTPLSVNNNDATMRLLTFGHNGTAYQLNSTASIRAVVDNSYVANGANIPLGWSIQVNDTNGGVNNQAKIHNFYSNGNVQFANTVFVTDSFTSGGNITSNTGIFNGNGSGLTNINGANVNTVPYANYANFAGEAVVANSVAVANVSGIGNIATVNLDGNASNILFGNGVFSSIPSSSILANGTSNVSIPVANGNVNISANGNANIAQFDTNGALFLYPTTSSTNGLRINSYGNPISGDVSRIASFRARGNATTPASVQAGDALMRLLAFGHNGNIQQTSSTGSLRAIVDSSYTTGNTNIPVGWQILVNDTNGGVNNQTKTHNFYANGLASFASNVAYSGTLNLTKFNELTNYLGNVSGTVTPDLNSGSMQSMMLTGNITLNSLANVVNGSSATLKLVQDGTGNRTLSSTMKFASGFKTLSTAPNSVDIISVFYDGADYYATLTTGYA
jgi:hypothetical protein